MCLNGRRPTTVTLNTLSIIYKLLAKKSGSYSKQQLFCLIGSVMAIRSALPPQAEVHVMIAGLPRTGKSTALNNIFGLELEVRSGPKSVTDVTTSTLVTKNGITLKVVDTPGLKAVDVNERVVIKEMTKLGIEKDFILLMTLSVSLGSTISSDYVNIIKNLNTIFGTEIWNRCIILLTYSDATRNTEFNSDTMIKEYQEHLNSYCEFLQAVLTKHKIKKTITLFSDYKSLEQFEDNTLDEIVAMPVGKNPEVETKLILPDLTWAHDHKWNDLLLMEITKMKDKVSSGIADNLRAALICFRYGSYVTQNEARKLTLHSVADAASGAVAGASSGGVLLGFSVASVGLRPVQTMAATPAALSVGALGGAIGGARVGVVAGHGAREIGVKNICIPQLVRNFLVKKCVDFTGSERRKLST